MKNNDVKFKEDPRNLVLPKLTEKKDLYYIVHDDRFGRMEVPAGSGEMQVCTGYKISRDSLGRRIETSVYRTMTF